VPQLLRGRRTKLQDPTADGLVADVQPSRGQQILDVAVAQGESQIEPNRVTNDAGWEAVANVRNGVHHHSYLIHRVTVTMPKSRSRWNRIAERGDGMVNFGVAGNGRDAHWLCSHGSPFLPDHLASVASFFGPH
jgi:hypothetical protein